jgi:hypothetical protein
LAAAAWWWLAPGGFPLWHVRTFTNAVAPAIVGVAAAAGLYALARQRAEPTALFVAAVPVFWIAVVVAACVTFPISMRRFGIAGLGMLAAVGGAWWFLHPAFERRVPRRTWPLAFAAALGMVLPICFRGGPASTRPLNVMPPDLTHVPGGTSPVEAITRGDRVHIEPMTGEIVFTADGVTIEVRPLLTFGSRSPDRCWTLFAPDAERRGLERQLVGRESVGETALLRYLDEGAHVLRVRNRRESPTCEIDAFSNFLEPVYSHLNTFCHLRIRSRHELRLTFSPCPDTPIAVPQYDTRDSAPVQFGYLREDGFFVIAEARRREKGPFHALDEGRLGRDGALQLRIASPGRGGVTITFDDWAAQASTALSPAAGWGIPQNAVEFQRVETDYDTTCEFWLSLAATSIGSGFDSVGHTTGTYRNRVRIEMTPR